MIYGYIRVSTDKQTTENQRFEILKFADEKKLSVDELYSKVVDEGQGGVSWVMVKVTPLREGVDTPCKNILRFPFRIHSSRLRIP